ncbi:MAG: toll/interleukin-1 receptor domain-containing protein [Geminicoccaceae bacterium]
METLVFISYSSVDRNCARRIQRKIDEIGLSTFLDEKNISLGENFKARISKGIVQCAEVIFVASPSSLKSPWVYFELGQAIAFGRPVITYRIHQALELPSFLADFQATHSLKKIQDHFRRRYVNPPPYRAVEVKDSLSSVTALVKLAPSSDLKKLIQRFPPLSLHGNVAIDGAVELHLFPNEFSPHGGITQDQVTTKISTADWPSMAAKSLSKTQLDILGRSLRSWAGSRRARPNRIRYLLEPPLQMVLDNREFAMHIGNSDYFSMRTIAELSREIGHDEFALGADKVFDTFWGRPGHLFHRSIVPYHLSAHGIVFLSDPERKQRFILLTLPSSQRVPLVGGWNVSFAEQMWAPRPDSTSEPWWQSYVDGLDIEAPADRRGDTDVFQTFKRGIHEELAIEESDFVSQPKLIATCIESKIYFMAFVFVVEVNMTLRVLAQRQLVRRDREIGAIAAYPISGVDQSAVILDPAEQLARLMAMERFDGGPYLLPKAIPSAVDIWHWSSRLRLYFAARHLTGGRILEYATPTE